MDSHIKILGIVRIVYGALGLLLAFAALAFFGGIGAIVGAHANEPELEMALPMLGFIGIAAFIFLAIVSIPSMIAGWGLLHYRPWARIITIVLSCLDILNFPIGTAVGVYGLWVLFARETVTRFERQPVRYS